MKKEKAELLKGYREAKNMTQDELAKEVGVSRGVIAMLESNEEYETHVSTAKRIGDVLGFNWVELYED